MIQATWDPIAVTDGANELAWERALPPGLIFDPPATIIGGQPLEPGYVAPGGGALLSTIAPGYVSPVGDRIGNVEVEDPPAYFVYRKDPVPWRSVWGRATTFGPLEILRWGHGPQLGPRDPPPVEVPSGHTTEPPPIPPSEKVYIVMNEVEVVLLPDRVPIEVNSVDLEASVDSWCWSLRMELADPAQLALLKPTAAGPKVVQVTLNGYPWTAVIEGRDSAREHASTGGRSATVSGRSQTALLSDTYTARRSLAIGDTRTAQQLALDEITERSLPFAIDWQGLDWIVPSGVWSYQDLAPIDAISQIAASRGAVVQSAAGDATLVIRARYPTSPWTWSADTADIALPLEWATSESAQQQSKPLYDAVFVIGQQQGVLARVTREGSAGETYAPQVVDGLTVGADVATERGRNILSDRGMQDLVSLEIPLFPAGSLTGGQTGLYSPLMLVDVVDPDDRYQALSVAVSISARRSGSADAALEIWQTVSLERHLSDAN